MNAFIISVLFFAVKDGSRSLLLLKWSFSMKILVSKKYLGLVAASLLSTITFSASADVGIAGCGLGSIVFKDNSKGSQILAATTNGTSGNQTFGITSGTSNCGSGVAKQANNTMKLDYVNANLSTLQREAAQGNGSSVNGLAAVVGCPSSSYAEFGAYTQSHYSSIFTSNNAEEVVNNINQEMLKNSELSKSCNLGNS